MNFLRSFLGMDVRIFLLSLPIILIALVVHEVSHGFIAMKLGDPTARNLGRLTLNPLKHLDPVGTICMVFLHFGWAKPVPINTRYFKKPKRDMALTALAGPASNLIMGFIGVLIMMILQSIFFSTGLMYYVESSVPVSYGNTIINVITKTIKYKSTIIEITVLFFYLFAYLNISLFLFNLIPIPPLDGSRILLIFLPTKAYFAVMKYERYIMLGFFVLLFVGSRAGLIGKWMQFLVTSVINGMEWLIGLIPGL